MTYSWKEWEGRTVDGKFVLGNYLGGSEGCAVFRTRVGSEEPARDAAIKLVALSGAEAESQLRRWQEASRLSHPNLIRILTIGRCTVEGRELVYALEELAEENLAQIVPERALTAEEARAMLTPVLAAIELVHGKGLVHGRIRPANILAAGDQVKLSSDGLRPAGEIPQTVTAYDAPEVLAEGISAASDMWSLGITLVEVLTQHRPAWDPARLEVVAPDLDKNVPEPFREIARSCLQVDPAKRAGVREIASRLAGGREERPERRPAPAVVAPTGKSAPIDAITAAARKRANGPYLLVLAAAIVVTIFLVVRPRPSRGPAEVHTSPSPPQTSSPQTPPSQTSSREQPATQSSARGMQPSGAQKPAATDEVVERATPHISPSAQRTISGKLKVRVRVEVDAAGNVTEAKLKDAGPSQYFARAALEAARRWKFAPANGEIRRGWTLLFAFTRARTEMSASRAR
jgi:TonB family protein